MHFRETADLIYSDIDSPYQVKTDDDDVVIIERIQDKGKSH